MNSPNAGIAIRYAVLGNSGYSRIIAWDQHSSLVPIAGLVPLATLDPIAMYDAVAALDISMSVIGTAKASAGKD